MSNDQFNIQVERLESFINNLGENDKKMIHLLQQVNQNLEELININQFLLKTLLVFLISRNPVLCKQLNPYLTSLYESIFEPDFLENLCNKR